LKTYLYYLTTFQWTLYIILKENQEAH